MRTLSNCFKHPLTTLTISSRRAFQCRVTLIQNTVDRRLASCSPKSIRRRHTTRCCPTEGSVQPFFTYSVSVLFRNQPKLLAFHQFLPFISILVFFFFFQNVLEISYFAVIIYCVLSCVAMSCKLQ